jgi:SAM-dependent methyltransferase
MAAAPTKPSKPESLDEIVGQSAAVIAEQIRRAAAMAKSEMDLQIDVAGALRKFAGDAKITLEGHHNVTIATGRPDSVYGSVIVEYKEPGKLSPNKDAAPNKAVIDQLKKRFYDMRREEHRQWNSMFGVGTDGKYFIFLRFRDDKWTDQEPLEVNRYSTERFLWALYNLGQKGKPYQPEYLHGDFGSESQTAQEGVRALYEEILTTTNPKAQVFFNQWKILFGEVCGYDVENLSDKLNKLAEFYLVKGKTQPAQLLFAVHTYYAILIKLLASEIVSFFNPWMTRQVERLQSADSSAKLKRELEELEQGGVFHTLGITNFLEGDLFAWYLAAWTAPVEKLVRAMVTKLDLYNPGTFSEDPAQSRDLLKKLYQQLFPKSVRHDLGEYYTPDWLADHVLNELGYEGDPDKRLLDPACGSGTFLVMAINRIRRWYDQNREKCAYDEGELLKKILANVIGFDLNPLAVMAARTNYLVAIKDLIRYVEGVEIPVYLCDSIMTPAEYGDLFTGEQGKVAKVPCSAMKPPHLLVPKEIAQNPKDVALYAQILEACVKNAYTADEFLSRCRDDGLNITTTEAHVALYKELVRLDKENKNGIWARIIKNNFAPLFVGRVDYVAGNPPWVNWESLPSDYRDALKPLWQEYGLFTLSGSAGRLGGGKKDLAMLFVYGGVDNYLGYGGRLGFVITQSVFKTKGAGDGFRRLAFEHDGTKTVLRPLAVHDLSRMQVFEGAINRTAVFVCKKQLKPFSYPIPYVIWSGQSTVGQDETLRAVLRMTSRQVLDAIPSEPDKETSPWLTGPTKALAGIGKTMGRSRYKAYAGCCTWLNGVFWTRVLKELPNGRVLIENLSDIGKIKVPRVEILVEPDLIYPLIRGRDVSNWNAKPSAFIILTQDPRTRSGIPEATMKKEYPGTYAYLRKFEDQLRKRSGYGQYFDPSDPFWSVYNVGTYSLSAWKVAWPGEVAPRLNAAVVHNQSGKTIICDQTAYFVDCSDEDQANFLCAVLNSSPVCCYYKVVAYKHTSMDFIKSLASPAFHAETPNHKRLSDLGKECRRLATKGDAKLLAATEVEIDKTAAKLWGITDDELRAIQEALAETGRDKRAADTDEIGETDGSE